MDITYKKLPNYGELIPIEKFIDYCKNGNFIDDDGDGYLATDKEMTNIAVYPSNIKDCKKYNFEYVIWFNK